MDVSRADAALIVGTDKSHVNDPTSYEFDANVAADLKAGVFLAVCTIDRWPHELDETVKLSIEGMEAAGNKVLGIFVTGCEPRHAFSVKETLAKYGLPVWTLPQVPFTDESTKDLALETFRKNAPTDEVARRARCGRHRAHHPVRLPVRPARQGQEQQEDHRAARRRGGPHHQGGRLPA